MTVFPLTVRPAGQTGQGDTSAISVAFVALVVAGRCIILYMAGIGELGRRRS